ncbi:hypothetical protein [Loktanella sp. R86503]|uniref:hypothetical protein n=1 Tax=Loktanella sp. R86503 TaxID=3093847 RepID=UPI0036D7A9BF
MRNRTAHLLLAFSLITMLAPRVFAQNAACLSSHDMPAALARTYDEHLLATALTQYDMLIALYVSAKGTWTMTVSRPDGPACIIASGHDFNLAHRDGLVPATPT